MKFIVAALPLLAVFTQSAVGIALPRAVGEELEARHHMASGRAGGNKFGGAGNANKGGKGTTGTGTVAAGAGAGAAVGAGAAGVAAAKGGNTGTSTSVAAAATTTAATTGAGNATTAASTQPGGTGSNSGLTAAQVTALQTSLTLDKTQIQPALADDGQDIPEAGQVASLTSQNNFVNFCATQSGVPLTNGLQIKTGSCNPTIMGRIIQTDKIPTSKFTFPVNMQTIAKNTTFTIKMAVANMVTGNFVNAAENYYAAPCQVDNTGTVIGHSHVVIEPLSSITQTTVTQPLAFSFFKGLNAAAVGGVLTADVTGGLAPGAYRLASINTCSNHQPVLASVAQHGSMDDQVYFTVTDDGAPAANAAAGGAGTATSATAAAPPAASTTAAAAAGAGQQKGAGAGKVGNQNKGGRN